MRTVIYVHPYQESFCNAIFSQIRRDDDKVIDLYKEKFNPVYSKKELSGWQIVKFKLNILVDRKTHKGL